MGEGEKVESGLELRGFIVSVRCPSEESLSVSVDASHLDGSKYIELVRELQDALSELDQRYSERAGKRSLKARYRRVVVENTVERKRVLKFVIYPMRFSNKVGYIRASVYDALNNIGVPIVLEASGNFKRALYVLSQEGVHRLNGVVERFNREIDDMNRAMASIDVSSVIDILKRYALEPDKRLPLSIPHIRVSVIPVRLTTEVVEEWRARDPVVARMIDEERRRLVESAVREFEARLEPILKKLAERELLDREMVKRRLGELERLCHDVGLGALARGVIVPLMELVDDPLKRRATDARKFVSERISSLISSL